MALKRCCAALALLALSGGLLGAVLELPSQSTTDGGVNVTVTPVDLDLNAALWRFKVVLDTHSDDLRDDLTTTTVLIDDRGESRRAVDWQGAAPGGHHREGVLAFEALKPVPAVIELRIARAGEGASRIFRWALPK